MSPEGSSPHLGHIFRLSKFSSLRKLKRHEKLDKRIKRHRIYADTVSDVFMAGLMHLNMELLWSCRIYSCPRLNLVQCATEKCNTCKINWGNQEFVSNITCYIRLHSSAGFQKSLSTFSGAGEVYVGCRQWVRCSSPRLQCYREDWQQQKRCCQPGQIDTRDLTSLSARKGKPKLKHSMLVSLCVRSNNMFLYRLKYINGVVWLRRKKKKKKDD